jgi:rhamnosyltransferase
MRNHLPCSNDFKKCWDDRMTASFADEAVVGVLVAHNTDPDSLRATLRDLAPQLRQLIVVDNSDSAASRGAVECASFQPHVEYLPASGNVGIGAAHNLGLARALELKARYVLFLDDDSSLPAGGVDRLVEAFSVEQAAHPHLVAVGPRIFDSRTHAELTFAWKGNRIRPAEAKITTKVAFLLSSGALVDVTAFEHYGTFREEYFIDHVDKEWGLRVESLGGRLIVTPDVVMGHQLGDSPKVSRRRNKVTYRHVSPLRNYYLTRNAVLLLRDVRLPAPKFIGEVWLLLTSSIRRMLDRTSRSARYKPLMMGLVDGILNRRGPRFF